MKKIALVLLCLVLCCPLVLGACADDSKTITVFNWVDYIDPDVIAMFEEETGYKVNYANFDTNEIMYTRLSRSSSNYDVLIPSDYMIERLIKEELIQPLDRSKLPNFQHISPWLWDPAFDPGSAYSVPYMWGTVGILYNTTMTGGEIDSWGAMWDTQYMSNVLMIDSVRDTMGVTLKYLGYDINSRDVAQLEEARDLLIEQRKSGVLLAYGVDEIKDKLINGEAALGLVWSGDAMYSMEYNEDLAYCVPKEGSNIWVDSMCIPTNAKNVEGALAFINFMMRPDIAALNSEYIGYSTPNYDALDILGEDYINDPTFNPPGDVIDRCQFFLDLGDFVGTYERLWQEAKTK